MLLKTRSDRSIFKSRTPYTHLRQISVASRRDMRMAASKATMQLETLMKMTEGKLVKTLWDGGHLTKLTRCPKASCNKKTYKTKARYTLGKLQKRTGRSTLAHRCWKCKSWVPPHHGSPIFSINHGNRYVSLQKQAGVLFCAAWGVQQSLVPALIQGVGPKMVSGVYTAIRKVVSSYMKVKQEVIKFDAPEGSLPDEFEVDEAVLRKLDIGDNKVQWNEMVGLKRRGIQAVLS